MAAGDIVSTDPWGPVLADAEDQNDLPEGLLNAIAQQENVDPRHNNPLGLSNDAGVHSFTPDEALQHIYKQAQLITDPNGPYAAFARSGDIRDLAKVWSPVGAANDIYGTNATEAAGIAANMPTKGKGRILSSDPTAGAPASGPGRILSTDPRAGIAATYPEQRVIPDEAPITPPHDPMLGPETMSAEDEANAVKSVEASPIGQSAIKTKQALDRFNAAAESVSPQWLRSVDTAMRSPIPGVEEYLREGIKQASVPAEAQYEAEPTISPVGEELSHVAAGALTPGNIVAGVASAGLGMVGGGLSAVASRLVSAGFSAQAAQSAAEAYGQLQQETDPVKRQKLMVDLTTSGAFSVLAGLHAGRGVETEAAAPGAPEPTPEAAPPGPTLEERMVQQRIKEMQGVLGEEGLNVRKREPVHTAEGAFQDQSVTPIPQETARVQPAPDETARTINVGDKTNTGQPYSVKSIADALPPGVDIEHIEHYSLPGETEGRNIVVTNRPLTEAEITDIAKETKQDVIFQGDKTEGGLKPGAWGDFDPNQFYLKGGETLADRMAKASESPVESSQPAAATTTPGARGTPKVGPGAEAERPATGAIAAGKDAVQSAQNEILNGTRNVFPVVEKVTKGEPLHPDDIATVIAQKNLLNADAARLARKGGPDYARAQKVVADFEKNVYAPVAEKAGTGLSYFHGSEPDVSTFEGIHEAITNAKGGKPLTPTERVAAENLAKRYTAADAAERAAEQRLYDEGAKFAKDTKAPSIDELKEVFKDCVI